MVVLIRDDRCKQLVNCIKEWTYGDRVIRPRLRRHTIILAGADGQRPVRHGL